MRWDHSYPKFRYTALQNRLIRWYMKNKNQKIWRKIVGDQTGHVPVESRIGLCGYLVPANPWQFRSDYRAWTECWWWSGEMTWCCNSNPNFYTIVKQHWWCFIEMRYLPVTLWRMWLITLWQRKWICYAYGDWRF